MTSNKSIEASVVRTGEQLTFAGPLDRNAVTRLWPQLCSLLPGIRQLSISDVSMIDSAGLALLAEVMAQLRAQSATPIELLGEPNGIAELCAAYRLASDLDFVRSIIATT
ncbi:MAG: STAS domain-containing protein [Xanthomonadaceae bacterium]|jgi:phospholipid transport system transporter-binding protein|nr:STAS domain-containing protein [Xanthomonadaceae bacterium]